MFSPPLGAGGLWRWARAHAAVDITGEGGALATRNSGIGWRLAVCGEVLQAESEAYAEFTWGSGDSPMVGVARAGVDPSSLIQPIEGVRVLTGGKETELDLSLIHI